MGAFLEDGSPLNLLAEIDRATACPEMAAVCKKSEIETVSFRRA
jgi:hypothetical protein